MLKRLLPFLCLAAAYLGANAQSLGTKIGQTYYDLQSNNSSGNRLVRHADGTLSASWTESCTSDLNNCSSPGCTYSQRGAGYNYYNGSSWVHGQSGTCPDAFGVFSGRVGWPEIISLPNGCGGTKEVVIAHAPLQMVLRLEKGTGGLAAWTANLNVFNTPYSTISWPPVVTVGNTIHMVLGCESCTTSTGVVNYIMYYRSLNGGLN